MYLPKNLAKTIVKLNFFNLILNKFILNFMSLEVFNFLNNFLKQQKNIIISNI